MDPRFGADLHPVGVWGIDDRAGRGQVAAPARLHPAAARPSRFRINVMSAVASRGALWFTVFPGKFTSQVFCAFLDRLARHAGRKVHVIADRHPVQG
ncbi:transposase [Streptomyces sp. MMS24-I2-30]|uniref:transposase n=1 Tax=Streptomyces sp. MMS24-I2-30 TaxID=3351564 RepID=UPI003896A2E1